MAHHSFWGGLHWPLRELGEEGSLCLGSDSGVGDLVVIARVVAVRVVVGLISQYCPLVHIAHDYHGNTMDMKFMYQTPIIAAAATSIIVQHPHLLFDMGNSP